MSQKKAALVFNENFESFLTYKMTFSNRAQMCSTETLAHVWRIRTCCNAGLVAAKVWKLTMDIRAKTEDSHGYPYPLMVGLLLEMTIRMISTRFWCYVTKIEMRAILYGMIKHWAVLQIKMIPWSSFMFTASSRMEAAQRFMQRCCFAYIKGRDYKGKDSCKSVISTGSFIVWFLSLRKSIELLARLQKLDLRQLNGSSTKGTK